ncbi:hypothetical protein [Natrinema zhouii]|uniref:hypothetical protein n=1 Tax=Natrinema zhouii TaxID=1710539 RepID=UPI003CE5AB1D
MHGPPDRGKTNAAQLLVRRLKQATDHIRTAHIDCLDKNTYTSVLTELFEGLGGTAKLPNSAGYELIDELRSNQSVTRVSLVVILLTQPTQIL